MRIFFLIFLLAYVGGNVYIFIRTLQMLSGFSLAMKILLSVIYWLVAFSLVIAMLTRHIDMPVILSKSMFHIGSVWLVFTLYMIFALLIADVTRIFVPSLNHGFYYALGATCCLLLYGYYNYRHPQVNKIDVFLDKPIEGNGINIVAVSDVHLGYGTGKAMLAVSSIPIAIQYCKIIRRLMAEKTASGTFAKYADAPVAIVYSDNQKYEKCSSMNGGVAEDKVIDNFKTAKNGLIIVVDKLQTGFDEPKLHTLFLDKEIRDINAIQTISRVNRKTKYKEECHIIDFSFGNVNEKNIRDAFAKFCGMVITDFDPLREKAIIQELYRELLAQPIYIKWFERYKSSVNNAEANAQLCLDMDADIRAWIKNVMEAHAQYTQDLKTHSEETAATSDDDPAKALRKTIGRYNSLLVLLQGVIELDAQFKDAVFIDFWQRYCNIYRSIFEQKDSIGSIHTTFDGEIGLLVSDEVEIEEPQEQDDAPENSRSKKNTGENRGGLASIFDTLARLNATEQEREQEIQFYFTKTNEFYEFLKSDGRFMAMLRSPNFSRDEIEKEYNKLIRRFLRQAEDVKIKKLIDENKEMFLEDFKNKIVNE